MYQDMPMRRILDVFERLLYGKNALGRDIAGSKKTVAGIRRRDFFSHLEKFYHPGNIVLVVAGRFSSRKVRRLAKKYFFDLKEGPSKRSKKLRIVQKKSRLELVYKKTDQAHFCLGVPGVSCTHKDRFVVSVIASILGYSRTSRIYRRIREERGWAYYVQTVPEFYQETGAVYTRAGISLDKVEPSVGLILKEYQRLKSERVDEEELKRAKDYIRGRFILALEDSCNVASRYAIQAVVEKRIRTPQETLKLIDQVTSEDIIRVAKRLFKSEKMNLALIGPFKSKERFKKLL